MVGWEDMDKYLLRLQARRCEGVTSSPTKIKSSFAEDTYYLRNRSTIEQMSQFHETPYDTMIHDMKTGRLATLAEVIARHSREQQISLEDADAYVKELLEIPSSRFHIEDEHIEDEHEDEFTYEIQRVQHAQVAAQTLLAATTLLTQSGTTGLSSARITKLIHGAFGVLENFYGDPESTD